MRVLIAAIVSGGLGLIGSPTWASDAKPTDDPSRKFFEQYCQTCHTGTKSKGDFRVDTLAQDFADKENRENWLKVVEQLKTGTMPPKGKPRPAANETQALTDWIDGQVAAAQAARNARQGRAVMRRLNQAEYENTVRDLLGVEVELKDVLPVDSTAGGFDTSAEMLHVSSYLLHNYLRAAERVLDAAVAGGPRPAQVSRRIDVKTATRQQGVSRELDDGVAIFASDLSSNIQTVFWSFLTRDRGKYRFRISAYAYQSEKPVIFHVNGGTDDLGVEPYLIGHFEVPPDKPTVVEFVEQMEAGRNFASWWTPKCGRCRCSAAADPKNTRARGWSSSGSISKAPWEIPGRRRVIDCCLETCRRRRQATTPIAARSSRSNRWPTPRRSCGSLRGGRSVAR